MLGADVLVTHPLRFILRRLQNLAQTVAGYRLRGVRELRQPLKLGRHVPAHGSRIDAELPQRLGNQTVGLIEEGEEQRNRLELRDIARFSFALRVEDRFLRFLSEFCCTCHAIVLLLWRPSAPPFNANALFHSKSECLAASNLTKDTSSADSVRVLHPFTHQPRQVDSASVAPR